jgi:hypothetical protein
MMAVTSRGVNKLDSLASVVDHGSLGELAVTRRLLESARLLVDA